MPVSLRSVPVVAALALVSLSGAACVDISAGNARYTESSEKRFTVTGAPTLHVDTFDGSVEVGTWDRPEVLVVVEKMAIDKQAADRMVVETTQDGDRVSVSVREPKDGGLHWNIGSFSAHITVTVPAQARVEANTGDGRVAIHDVTGDLTVKTGDGSIRLDHINGAVEAASGDGSIDIDGVITSLKARSGDGRVRLRTTAASSAGEWEVSTGDGTVVVEVPEGFGAELDALTGDGRVRVEGVEFSGRERDEDRSRARGRLGNGGAKLTIRSGDGSITVRRGDAM